MKYKVRYITAALLVIISIAFTLWAISYAYEFRGYKAFGGEYFLIPLGLFFAYVVLALSEWLDEMFKYSK